MQNEDPLLTIAIATYNSAHYLPDAIASVMCQGLDDFEIVIVDNASEDNTKQIVESLNNLHIRYIRNSSNLGAVENPGKEFNGFMAARLQLVDSPKHRRI